MLLKTHQAVVILSLYDKHRIWTRDLDLKAPIPDYHNTVPKDTSNNKTFPSMKMDEKKKNNQNFINMDTNFILYLAYFTLASTSDLGSPG